METTNSANQERQQHETLKDDPTNTSSGKEFIAHSNKPQPNGHNNHHVHHSHQHQQPQHHYHKENPHQQQQLQPPKENPQSEPNVHQPVITSQMLSSIVHNVSNMEHIQYNNYDIPWGSKSVETYEKIEQIGEGTFGQVYKAKHKETGDIVALKKVIMDNEVEGFPITAIREIKILKELHHPNVIHLREVVTSKASTANNQKGSVYMVFEYMDHDLNGLMDSPAFKYFSPQQIKCYLKQLLEGLDYCHRNNVLHRDIKGSNLLLNNSGILKLADFGLARPFNSADKRMTNRVITLWYRPPELLLGGSHYGPEIDMWSVGCIMAELLSKKTLFPGRNSIDQLDKIYQICGSPNTQNWTEASDLPYWETLKPKREYPRQLREHYQSENKLYFTKEAFDLLDKLLCMDPKKRITASEALDSAYFWTEPLPCNPKDLPQYPSCHEYRNKKRIRQQQQPQQGQPAQQQTNQQQTQSANLNLQQPPPPNYQGGHHQPNYQNGNTNINYKKQRTDINYQTNQGGPLQPPGYNGKAPYGSQSNPPSNQFSNQQNKPPANRIPSNQPTHKNFPQNRPQQQPNQHR
ncbi:hypothetical protein DICPUDRAFT_157293 [Dictyostelium purpureum]|uniref:Protein kinase domain-containing protein n=1 Tax=Dictyostelium purpureum TaxID=5786 RepID=F0ZYR6_DICPU|nr:uncharacterized protein DICPUDRAFT_157293 [Dictyostelium purpureum]EGC30913.1 hypothetical protein DICPUDRAFT_157293 [Dictyostelium purpureum]|eukprot:XP_003292563.1 hypothetical protein DICPUDRAFT_157293 [Dictyostelium purpureum]